MSIQTKIFGLITLFIVLVMTSSSLLQWYATDTLNKKMDTVTQDMSINSQKRVEEDLQKLTSNISNHILSLENQVDSAMLNAAYALQKVDATQTLTNEELSRVAKQTGMTDLLVTDRTGVFTHATEEKSLGLNLFSFDEQYRSLLTEGKESVKMPLMLKQETNEIFKFLAIPRADEKGVIEAAMNAEVFEESLSKYIEQGNGIEAIYLVNRSGLVLTETLSEGQSSLWGKGETVKNENIATTFTHSEPVLEMKDEKAEIYYPIVKNDNTMYVLFAQIDTTPYFLNASIANQALSDVQHSMVSNIFKSMISTVLIAALFTALLMMMIRKNLKPLKDITAHAKKIASGDLRMSDLSIKSKDEIGNLAASFNQMAGNLRHLIQQISLYTEQVAASSEELTANAEQMSGASEQIASTVQGVSSATEEQVQSVEDMTRTIHVMSGGIQQISDRSQQVAVSAGQSLAKASEGNKSIQTAVNQMNEIEHTVHQAANVIEELGERSNQIGGFAEIITDIAAQTNLLALNAAIEAARAGSHGSGFAVVAQEVRKLAEQSSQSASQINQLIAQTQTETEKAVESMKKVTQEVAEGIEIVHDSGLSFQEIQQAVQEVSSQIQAVSQSVEHVAQGTEQVAQVIHLVKEKSNETASGMMNVSSSTEEQLASMQEVSSSSAALSSMAEELQKLTGNFKV